MQARNILNKLELRHLYVAYVLILLLHLANHLLTFVFQFPFPLYSGYVVLMGWGADGTAWTLILWFILTCLLILSIPSLFMKPRWYTVALSILLQLYCLFDIIICATVPSVEIIQVILDVFLIGMIAVGFYVNRKKTNE